MSISNYNTKISEALRSHLVCVLQRSLNAHCSIQPSNDILTDISLHAKEPSLKSEFPFHVKLCLGCFLFAASDAV